MSQLSNKIKKNFTVIPNELILDNTLSDRARFLFCLLASKPMKWNFYNNALAKELNYSIDTLRKYINELVSAGWIIKESELFKSNKYTLLDRKSAKINVSEKTRHIKNKTHKNHSTYKEIHKEKNKINKKNIILPHTKNKKSKKIPFKIFWEVYDKKIGYEKRIKNKWDALEENIQEKILEHIIEYKKAQKDKQFRKNPEKYLDEESWNDEIILAKENKENYSIGDYTIEKGNDKNFADKIF